MASGERARVHSFPGKVARVLESRVFLEGEVGVGTGQNSCNEYFKNSSLRYHIY